MALITLGSLQLDGFEVPASIRFGGAQRTVIHKLLSGGRIIDTMGRDDCALTWRGVLSGAGAGDRARTLDALRASGITLPLVWDAFSYDVIIGDLQMEYCNPWWIPYQIECVVVTDLAQSGAALGIGVAADILGDLTSIAPYVELRSLLTTVSAPNALAAGSSELSPALIGLSAVQTAITSGIGSAEQGLDSQDLATLVSSSGTLAQLSTAHGYVGRTITNLEGILA